MWHPSGLQPQCCFLLAVQWWLFQQTEGISGLASTWRICHDMSDISRALWAFLSHKDCGNSHCKAQRFHTRESWVSRDITRGGKTTFNTAYAHVVAPSLLPPGPNISVSTYPFSSAPLSPANFPIQTVSLCLCHLLPYYSLDSWLPASCQLLAVPPVNPKVSLFLLKDISFNRKRTTSSCCSSSSATTGEKVWLHCGN